jgi:4-hydroxy-tetrahydrodipicolinate synthase
MKTWRGVFPAVTTKMTPEGAVDGEATQAGVERLIRGGVCGVIVLPMLGENTSLNLREREFLIRGAAEAVAGRVPLLCGLCEATLETARNNARSYEGWGAEGLMVFPSLGYHTDLRETVHWYRSIAAASSLPIMIYNNPGAYKVDITPEILEQLTGEDKIRCIKEETGDTRRVTDICVALGQRFQIFCGVDDMLLESIALGASGWVSGMTNVWPAECVELFNLCIAGKWAQARALYHLLTPSFHLDTHVKLVQYVKLAEHVVHGAPEWARAPRLPLAGEERLSVIRTVTAAMTSLERRGGIGPPVPTAFSGD